MLIDTVGGMIFFHKIVSIKTICSSWNLSIIDAYFVYLNTISQALKKKCFMHTRHMFYFVDCHLLENREGDMLYDEFASCSEQNKYFSIKFSFFRIQTINMLHLQ
jgi:hypothetical protein